MKTWMLGALMAAVTGGGVAYVLAGKESPPPSAHAVVGAPAPTPAQSPAECPDCQPSRLVVDLVDVNTLTAADATRPAVSFDEPPFAQPKAGRAELAPMPRAVVDAEVAPMPRAAE